MGGSKGMISKSKKYLFLAIMPLMVLSLLNYPFTSAAPQQLTPGAYITESFSMSLTSSGGSAEIKGTYNYTVIQVSPTSLTYTVVWDYTSITRTSGGTTTEQDTKTGTVTVDVNSRLVISSTCSDFYLEVGHYCDLWIPTDVGIGSELVTFDDNLVVRSSTFFDGYECWNLVPSLGLSGFGQHAYYEKETGIYLGVYMEGNLASMGYLKAQSVVTSTNIDALSNITGRIGGFPWWIIIVVVVVVIVAVSIVVIWRRRRKVTPPPEGAPEIPEGGPAALPPSRFCPYCGTENLREALFCANCGSNLEGAD